MQHTSEDVLTIMEASGRVGLSPFTIRGAINRGRIKAARSRKTGKWEMTSGALQEYLDSRWQRIETETAAA